MTYMKSTNKICLRSQISSGYDMLQRSSWSQFGQGVVSACVYFTVVKFFRYHHTTTILRPFFWDHPGESVPEENFWTLWCKGRLTEADTQDNMAERHSVPTTRCPPPPSPIFLQAGCPSCRPTNSVKALKATSAFGLGRRR